MFAGKKSAQIREILISESAWEEMTCLFAPSLESVLAFIFVGVMAMLICGLFYNDYLEQQPATPEQLTEITQDTPCAAEAFKEAIKSDTSDYQPEPLSLGKAKELASACRERNEMAEVKRVRENERNKIREKQLQALNDAHSVKER
ncbi:YfiC protein [Escherichia coli]